MLSAPSVVVRPLGAVVGVTPGVSQHEVIATVKNEGVYLYDARTQTELHMWKTRAGTQLTNPAVLHPASGRVVCVRDYSVVFSWHRDDEVIDLDCAQNVGGPVLTLLHDPSLLDGIVVVRLDGSAAIFDATLSRQIGTTKRPKAVCATAGRPQLPVLVAVRSEASPRPGSAVKGSPW